MKTLVGGRIAAAFACLGMLAQPAFAAAPVAAPVVADIALAEGGLLTGKIVNAQGAPQAKTEVLLQQAGQEIARTQTNEQGVFAVQGLRGGLYQVVSQSGAVSYRLWAPNTAPPAANQSALIVTGEQVLNGQHYGGGHGGIMTFVREHPLLVAAGIATAIAVPVALSDDDDDPAS